jgi:hypothetical protein
MLPPQRPQIFSQGDREIGSSASALGFTQLPAIFGATQNAAGRLKRVQQRPSWDVAEQLLVEVKAVESILFVHVAQAVSYLRITELRAGLIVNFNTALLRNGLRRVSLPPQPRTTPDLPISL